MIDDDILLLGDCIFCTKIFDGLLLWLNDEVIKICSFWHSTWKLNSQIKLNLHDLQFFNYSKHNLQLCCKPLDKCQNIVGVLFCSECNNVRWYLMFASNVYVRVMLNNEIVFRNNHLGCITALQATLSFLLCPVASWHFMVIVL